MSVRETKGKRTAGCLPIGIADTNRVPVPWSEGGKIHFFSSPEWRP